MIALLHFWTNRPSTKRYSIGFEDTVAIHQREYVLRLVDNHSICSNIARKAVSASITCAT